MRVIFAGTPEFAVPMLEAVARNHEVGAVVTQPDRPRGRSLHLEPTPLKAAAARLSLPVMQPENLGDPSVLDELRRLDASAVVVAAYGRILPREILELTPAGCVNVHPSLLPAYRGAAPIQRAIMNGDEITGVSIMRLDEGMDTGPIYAQAKVSIGGDETAGELAARLGREATRLLLGVLGEIKLGTVELSAQPTDGISTADKIEKDEAEIDWSTSTRRIHDQVRALNPSPGAHTSFRGRRLKVWRTAIEPAGAIGGPGEILQLQPHVRIATGGGDIVLLEVQPESKGRMPAEEFVRGYRPRPGDKLGE